MREALARMDLAAVVALLRSAAGMSREDLAEIVPNWSPTMIGRIERGERGTLYDLRELLAFADAVMMPREMLLPLITGDPDAALEAQEIGEGEKVDRRVFNGAVALTATGFLLPGWVSPPPATAADAHVRYLRTSIRSLYTNDWQVGGGALLREAVRLYAGAKAMLDRSDYSERIGRQLVGLCAELASCAGFLAYDAYDNATARRLFGDAVLLAGDAQDPRLAAHVFATMALHSTHLARITKQPGPAREALRLLDRAASVAKHEPSPKVHALIQLRRAPALALLGDEGTARQAITGAYRELERGPHETDPYPLAFVNEAEVAGFDAQIMLDLGKPEAARRRFEDVLAHDGLFDRNRVLYEAKVARSLHAAGDKAGAVEQGLRTLPSLEEGIASMRTLNQLRPLRDTDEEFRDRFDGIAAAMAG